MSEDEGESRQESEVDEDIRSDDGGFEPVEDDMDRSESSKSSSPIKGDGEFEESADRSKLSKHVRFSPKSESTQAPLFKGVKLPPLYRNERQGEIVY